MSGVCLAQDFQNGLYFIEKLEQDEECQDPIKSMHADSVYCLTGLPIIPSQDFVSLSKIKQEPIMGGRYFVIGLAPSSKETMKVIEAKALAENMGLIISNRLVGKVKVSELAEQGFIRVGKGLIHSELKKLHRALANAEPDG